MNGLPRTDLTDLIDNGYEVSRHDEEECKQAMLDLYIKGVKDAIHWAYVPHIEGYVCIFVPKHPEVAEDGLDVLCRTATQVIREKGKLM